jgi:hypothetical protein
MTFDDSFEDNDTLEIATDLSSWEGVWLSSVSELGI